MNRLGIFCTYDTDGIVDDYIFYLLQEIKKVVAHLTIVCNGKLTLEGRARLEQYSEDLYVRENVGFDMEAWRQGISRQKDSLAEYDELILFNDSFYGPFYPFEEIFSEMDEREPNADFWGITIHGKGEDPDKLCPYGYVPEHIQSYFLVIRKKLLHSQEFMTYWETAEVAQTFAEAIKKHEVCFTKKFFDMGFGYAVYCDTRKWESPYDIKMNPYVFATEHLLKEYHCPLIKKRVFYFGRGMYLGDTYGNTPRACLEFVRRNTNYDVSLILKNILRKHNIATIKEDLGLNYILPREVEISGAANCADAVIIAHLYYEDLISECVEYLCNTPEEIQLVVTVSNADKKNIVESLFKKRGRNCEVRLVESRGRDLSALFVGCADLFEKFKYLCFIHDKKSLRRGESLVNGEEFFHLLWRNVLGTENFVRNILKTFEAEPQLGILVPPQPHHGKYSRVFFVDHFWSTDECFNRTLALADDLGISRSLLDKNLAPPTIGGVFWCRTEALKKVTVKKWSVEDFPAEPMPIDGTLSHALERIFAYAAQTEGFYTGWLMSDDFARDEVENFMYLAKQPAYQSQPPLPVYVPTLTDLVKAKVPQKYWFLLKPVKKFLEKLGFNP